MGIDIQLSGCEERVQKAWNECEQALGKINRNGPELVDAMATLRKRIVNGRVGHLRSVYNSRGFFPLLDFIFGFDLAGYLFPGDWDKPVPIDAPEFLEKVMALVRTAKIGEQWQTPLPWIAIFEGVAGHPAPDGKPACAKTIAFMGSLMARFSNAIGNPPYLGPLPARITAEDFDLPSYGPLPACTRAAHIDYWPMLNDIHEFAKLAVELDARGKATFVTISY